MTQLRRMVGNGITFTEGEDWKHKRRILTQFLNFGFIKSVSERIYDIAHRKLEEYYTKNLQKKDRQ